MQLSESSPAYESFADLVKRDLHRGAAGIFVDVIQQVMIASASKCMGTAGPSNIPNVTWEEFLAGLKSTLVQMSNLVMFEDGIADKDHNLGDIHALRMFFDHCFQREMKTEWLREFYSSIVKGNGMIEGAERPDAITWFTGEWRR